MNKILYIDDSKENLERFQYKLGEEFEITTCDCPLKGLELAEQGDFDLILADTLMPNLNGLQFFRAINKAPWYASTPVVLKSLSQDEFLKLEALSLTKTDFLSHAMSFEEIKVRLSNLILRHKSHKKLRLGFSLVLDIDNVQAIYKGECLGLTKQEFKILKTLSAKKLKNKRDLVESVWGEGCVVDDNNINTHLVNLRKKLEVTSHRVTNVRNKGFRLTVVDQDEE